MEPDKPADPDPNKFEALAKIFFWIQCFINFLLASLGLDSTQKTTPSKPEALPAEEEVKGDAYFQKIWAETDNINQDTISILDNISDRKWVLRECLERIPKTADGTRALLRYGLKTTLTAEDVGAGVGIDESEDSELLDENFSEIDLSLSRWLLFRHLYSLETYMAVVEQYNPVEYLGFRCKHPTNAAICLGFEEKFREIGIIWSYHPEMTLPQKLLTLSYLPPSVNPEDYKHLLPLCEPGRDVEKEWEIKQWDIRPSPKDLRMLPNLDIGDGNDVTAIMEARAMRQFKKKMKEDHPKIPTLIYSIGLEDPRQRFPSPDSYSRQFEIPEKLISPQHNNSYPITRKIIDQWYYDRALALEAKSGIVDNALSLIKIGQENGVQGIEGLQQDLSLFKKLIYKSFRADISYEKYLRLSKLDRVEIILGRSPEQRFLRSDEWHLILTELSRAKLSEKVTPFATPEYCYEEALKRILDEPDFELARTYIPRVLNAYDLVLTAAKEFFNSAPTPFDQGITYSSQCLELLPPDVSKDEVKKEKNLIAASKLLAELGLKCLPVEVRLKETKIDFLKQILKLNDAYRNWEKLVEVYGFLGYSKPSEKNHLKHLIADVALKNFDFGFAKLMCSQLVSAKYTKAWPTCKELATCDQYDDLETRKSLLSFCLVHAPEEQLFQLLQVNESLSVRLRCAEIGVSVHSDSALVPNDWIQASFHALHTVEQHAQKSRATFTPSVPEDLTTRQKAKSLDLDTAIANREKLSAADNLNLNLSQLLFHLSASFSKGNPLEATIFLAKDALHDTTKLPSHLPSFFGYLLSIPKVTDAHQLFEKLFEATTEDLNLSTNLTILGCYYFSIRLLQSLAELRPTKNTFLESLPPLERLLDYPPRDIIGWVDVHAITTPMNLDNYTFDETELAFDILDILHPLYKKLSSLNWDRVVIPQTEEKEIPFMRFMIGLQSKDQNTKNEVLQEMVSHFKALPPQVNLTYQTDYDARLLALILESGQLNRFVNTMLFGCLVDLLLFTNNAQEVISKFKDSKGQEYADFDIVRLSWKNDATFILGLNITELVLTQCWGHACSIVLVWFNVHPSYRTLKAGFHLMPKYFEELIALVKKSKNEKWSSVGPRAEKALVTFKSLRSQ